MNFITPIDGLVHSAKSEKTTTCGERIYEAPVQKEITCPTCLKATS